MKLEEFLEQYKEFKDLFKIVSEPGYTKSILLEQELSDEDLNYYINRYTRYGGSMGDLPVKLINRIGFIDV